MLSPYQCDWWSHYELQFRPGRTSPCNEALQYESLAMDQNFLIGTLPKEIGKGLCCNQCSQYFRVATKANRKPHVPYAWLNVSFIALLTALTEISLVADNFFASTNDEDRKRKFITGSIPSEWMSSLTNLITLDLSKNARK